MDSYYTKEDGEIYYYQLRDKSGPDTIFVSKLTEFKNSVTGKTSSKRYIRKVYGENEDVEIVKINGEFLLRCSPKGRDQIKVVVHENDNEKIGFVIQKFRGKAGSPVNESNFSFYGNEFNELLEFLGLVRFIDLSKTENFKLSLSQLKKNVLVTQDENNLIESFKKLEGDDRLHLLEQIRDQNLTKQDLDVLSGRKDGLKIFKDKLYFDKDWSESEWQSFFENNTWIFGYGLDYRFLSILQREAHVSDSDIDGKNTVKSDFLLGSTDFTVVVELKRPNTKLFEKTIHRARSWKLSTELFDSVSQILAQKASWEKKSSQENYTGEGESISQKTVDPKCILVIGNREKFSGNAREQDMKFRTFEMFRRDSRNIEILTYDELYERAYFIVNQNIPSTKKV